MFNLAHLGALVTRIQQLKLLLQSEGETQQITIVSFKFAHDTVAFEDATRLVGLDECTQLLVT